MSSKFLRSIPLIGLLVLLSACSSQQVRDDSTASVPVLPTTPTESVTATTATAEPAGTEVEAAPRPRYATIWERLEASYMLPSCEIDKTSQKWADWYAAHPDYLARVLKRAEPWLFYIAEEIEKRDLPGEFAWLPIVESAFDPFAYSHMNAAGAWQFIASTGKNYGLEQNWWYDGRRDMYAATQAALDYLRDLGERFDHDWLLALASYNAGEGRVGRQVARQKARGKPADFWNLKLPRETRGYVPKMLGLRCLFENPEKYAIELPPIPDKPQVVVIDTGSQTDLVLAAQLADMPIAELYALNPGYSRWATAPNGPNRIVLPRENAENMTVRLADLEPGALMRWDYVSVQSGDTLGKLAARHNIPVAVLKATNDLKSDTIRVNQRLRLPRDGTDRIDPLYAAAALELQQLQNKLVAPTRINHRIRNGESLSTIARKYRVRVTDLQRWNGIRDPSRIRAGKTLKIFKSGAGGSYGRKSGSTRYTVKRGDSLWKIARQHNVSVRDLRRWNNLGNKAILRPGQKLKLVL